MPQGAGILGLQGKLLFSNYLRLGFVVILQ